MRGIFKNLRRKLIGGNTFSRYLVYALGELVVVIIGILIAINLNAWKAHTNDRATEQEYYCRLYDELQLEQAHIQEIIDKADVHIALGKKTILELYNQNVDKHTLMNDYLLAQRMDSYVPQKVTFDFLIASGDIKLLTDETITSSLSIYYAKVEDKIIQLHRNTEALASRASFGYDSFIEFGYQEFNYIGESLGPDLVKLLPDVEWNKDPSNTYYKKFVDNLVFVVAMNERMKQHMYRLLEDMQTPYHLLEEKCTASNQ